MSTTKPRIAHDFAGITMPTSSHPAIRRVRRRDVHPSIHGNKLWKSSCLLVAYLLLLFWQRKSGDDPNTAGEVFRKNASTQFKTIVPARGKECLYGDESARWPPN